MQQRRAQAARAPGDDAREEGRPEEARRLPYDTLVTFVRGYAYRVDWAEASFAYLDRCLKWRRQMDCARILDAPPAAGARARARDH